MWDALNRVGQSIDRSLRRNTPFSAEVRSTTSPLGLRAAADAFEVNSAESAAPTPRRPRTTYHRIRRVGQSTQGAATDPLLQLDDRTFSEISTVSSPYNIVEPLFASSLVPSGPENYRERLFQLIDEAQKFVFVEGYQLSDEALVDKLIEKARQGVQVTVLFDPVNPPEEQRKAQLLNRMRDVAKNDPAVRAANSLHVEEFKTVLDKPEEEDQILHIKRTIADRPNGAIGEVSGGINFGDDSHLNVDTGWYTEGVSVLDSLQKLVDHWPREGQPLPFSLDAVPSVPELRELMQTRESELVTVEIAASGKRRVEKPREYS
ncbi:MAG: phospholipase D-like domain-containing protein, partial [Myxococcota bacterium]